MPVSPLDGPPFRGRHATTLTRIVGTVRSVLDPDSVEMEYLFEPSGPAALGAGGVPGRGVPPDGPPSRGAHSAPRAPEAVDPAGGPALRGLPAASRPAPRERGRRRDPRGGPAPAGERGRSRVHADPSRPAVGLRAPVSYTHLTL